MPNNPDDINPDHDSMHQHNSYGNYNMDIPPTTDGSRPPQLNQAVRCPFCGSNLGGNDEGGDGGGGSRAEDGFFADRAHMRDLIAALSFYASEPDPVNGQEGLESDQFVRPHRGHRVHVPEYGMIPFWNIYIGLARHNPCDCHRSPMPGAEDYMNDEQTHLGDGTDSPSSMLAEASSTEHSLASSGFLSRSMSFAGLDETALVGALFATALPFEPAPRSYFIGSPLPLIEGPFRAEAPVECLYSSELESDDGTLTFSDDEDDGEF